MLARLVALTYHPDPLTGWRAVETLGLAARALLRIGHEGPIAAHPTLRRDPAEVGLYLDRTLVTTTVAALARGGHTPAAQP